MQVTVRPQEGFVAVAEGEGNATIETMDRELRWWVGDSAPAAGTPGLTLAPRKPMSMALNAGQTLYLTGAGIAYVLADNPIT